MNKQIRHVSVVALVLLAALLVSTTYWQTWAVGDLQARQDNATQLVARLTVDRGNIYASGRAGLLATSRPRHKHGITTYTRHYVHPTLAPQTIGSSTDLGTTTGLEQSYDDYLTGSNTNLSNAFNFDKLGGGTVKGDSLVTTLRPSAQRLALSLLAGRCGAVFAMNPKTGAVYVMASSPTYDNNLVNEPGGWTKIGKIKGSCGDASALYNNATQGLYTPGSTFKLVTASAALDTGVYGPNSHFYDPGYCIEYGTKVYNSSSPDSPTAHETFGLVTFSEALEHSINAVFCNIGKRIGAGKILEYAKRYGFYSRPPLDLPPSVVNPSGLYAYRHGRYGLFNPSDPATQVDPGRLAFGQERMLATPLQMGLVAATIADGGVEPRPYLVQKILAPNGSVVSRTSPQMLGRVIKPTTAHELNLMMQLVVQGGTGTAAQIPGVPVAGKTGTAETNIPNVYNAWFVSFAPANDPQVAVAVVVEKQPNGFGGAVAAPIAKAVMENLLHK